VAVPKSGLATGTATPFMVVLNELMIVEVLPKENGAKLSLLNAL
jgi:hypothetical protein